MEKYRWDSCGMVGTKVKKFDLITVGESMVLLTAKQQGYLRYVNSFEKSFAGAETNVAIGVSKMGYRTGWISKVGNDEFGKSLIGFLRGENVDVEHVAGDEYSKTGLMFKEYLRHDKTRINYYRKDSAASKLNVSDINIDYIKSSRFLFVSGITPLLSQSCYEAVMYALDIAKENDVTIVFDPNIRLNLWNGDESQEKILEIIKKSDIVLPGLIEADMLFNNSDLAFLGNLMLDMGPDLVVIKLGENGAHYFTKEENKHVPSFPLDKIIDPVGAGDAFVAGLISALLSGSSIYEAVTHGNACGAIVTQVIGDTEGFPDKSELVVFLNSLDEDVIR